MRISNGPLSIGGLLFVLIPLIFGACASTISFVGTKLDPPQSASDFVLQDHRGNSFRLADSRGKIVVLSFGYTSCTDVCPFIGLKMKQAAQRLGSQADNIVLVVVSTDPERDDIERVREYSQRLGMLDRWFYLIGTKAELEPVWQAYYVAAPVTTVTGHEDIGDDHLEQYGLLKGLDAGTIENAKNVIEEFGGGYHVHHSTPIWLIDRNGQIRVKLGMDATPSMLEYDIRLLLSEY